MQINIPHSFNLLMQYVCLITVLLLSLCPTASPQSGTGHSSLLLHKKQQDEILQKQFDSLKQLVDRSPDDTLKVLRLVLLSKLQSADTASASFAFANEGKRLATKLLYKRGLTHSLACLGSIHQVKKEYAAAIDYYLQALDVSETYDHHTREDDCYPAPLNLYFYLGDYPNAMILASRGLANAEKDQDLLRIARYNNLLGYIHCRQGNLPASKKYYEEYTRIAGKTGDSLMLAHAFGETSEVLMAERKYTDALLMLHRAYSICEDLIRHNRPPSEFNIGQGVQTLHINMIYKLSKAYKLDGKFNTALRYAREAINYTTRIACNNYEVASYYINTGDIYKELQDYKNAASFLQYGLMLSRDIRHKENTRDAYNHLSRIYALQHQYDSAYLYYRLFTALKDSIVNDQTRQKIAEVQARYDVEKKDKEIARQYLVRKIIIGAFIAVLVLLYLLYNRYRLQQQNKHQQQLNSQQNELFNTIINTQDKERKRIAQDIHDSLGSVLSAAKLKLSGLGNYHPDMTGEQQEAYLATLSLLDEAMTELRNISHNIMPAALSKLGLPAALQHLFAAMSSCGGLHFQFTTHGLEDRLPEETEISIYRMVLELVNNVVKHARASKVTVQLIRHPDHINIIVEDNGIGFDHRSTSHQPGIGLNNILSRVEYLEGRMDIDSGRHNGTTVMIDIPYPAPGIQ